MQGHRCIERRTVHGCEEEEDEEAEDVEFVEQLQTAAHRGQHYTTPPIVCTGFEVRDVHVCRCTP